MPVRVGSNAELLQGNEERAAVREADPIVVRSVRVVSDCDLEFGRWPAQSASLDDDGGVQLSKDAAWIRTPLHRMLVCSCTPRLAVLRQVRQPG